MEAGAGPRATDRTTEHGRLAAAAAAAVPARRPLDPARRPPRRRALGEPSRPLLARARHLDRHRDPGLRHRGGRRAPRRRSPVLVSLGFLAAAGFLGLHALATPKVLLDSPNGGFVSPRRWGCWWRRRSPRWRRAGRGRHAATSSACDRPHRAHGALGDRLAGRDRALERPDAGRVGLGAAHRPRRCRNRCSIGFAALRYAALYRRRQSAIIVAVATAFILLAEAMVAVAFARNWHASWWEWHVLMLAAFALVALAARAEGAAERFSDLYLEATAPASATRVMFADLAGFTAFSDRREPRAVRRCSTPTSRSPSRPWCATTAARSTSSSATR